jgi:hypothetical protein
MSDTQSPTTGDQGPAADASISELLQRLSDQSTLLARKEVELAKAELTEKGKKIGTGAGAFGGAAFMGVFTFAALTTAFILLLATALDAWIAALIVTAVYGAIAGVMALMGKKKIDEGSPPVPEQTIDSVNKDVETIKTSAKEGRS